MKPQVYPLTLSFFFAFFPAVDAAPARRSSNPPLRGSEALVGYSSTEKVASGTQPDIEYNLLPGQTVSPDIGAYLDFEKVENPQPIRGSTGSDDPGPRMLSCHTLYFD